MLKANDTDDDSKSYRAKRIWARAQLRELARNGKLGLRVRTEPVAVGGRGSSDALIDDRKRSSPKVSASAATAADARSAHHRTGELVLSDAMA